MLYLKRYEGTEKQETQLMLPENRTSEDRDSHEKS